MWTNDVLVANHALCTLYLVREPTYALVWYYKRVGHRLYGVDVRYGTDSHKAASPNFCFLNDRTPLGSLVLLQYPAISGALVSPQDF